MSVAYKAHEQQTQSGIESAAVHTELLVSSSFAGCTSRPEVKLRGVPDVSRVYDYLNLTWATRLAQFASDPTRTSVQLKADMWIDVSQCVSDDRRGTKEGASFGKPGVLFTSGLWYNCAEDVFLDGEDLLRLQGWPHSITADSVFSSCEKRELAAEGFNLGCFRAVFYAFFVNPPGPWWGDSSHTALQT